MALSMAEAERITVLSREHGAPICVPSAFETRIEVMWMRERLKALREQGAVITGAVVNHVTNDYPAHGTHAAYMLFTVLDPVVEAVRFRSDGWWGFRDGSMTWRCRQDGGPDYTISIVFKHGYRTVIQTTGGIVDERIRLIGDGDLDPYSRNKWHNYPTVYEFAKVVETGRMFESYEHILAKNRVFFAGWYSHLERNGEFVDPARFPGSWRAPSGLPAGISEQIRRQHRDDTSLRRMREMFPDVPG